MFSKDYRDKYEFVRKLFKEFKRLPAAFRIDTTKNTPKEVYKSALDKLKIYLKLDIGIDEGEIVNSDSD